jgi:hypothetical protein
MPTEGDIMHLSTRTAPLTTRRYPRAVFSVPLTLHYLAAGGVRKSRGISLDIGEGGLGALVEGRLKVGEMVAIDLPLADSILNAVAIVRYSSPLNTGFEFVGLTAEERMQIASFAGSN